MNVNVSNISATSRDASVNFYVRGTDETAKMLYNSLLFLIGGPLNILASLRLIKSFKKERRRRQTALNLLLLKTNLNISDLLIVFVHLPTEIGWQAAISWNGGNVLCKVLKFLSLFAFHLSSFAILSIAAERSLTVRRIVAVSKGSSTGRSILLKTTSVKIFLVATWVFAVILSLPQAYVWRTLEIVPSFTQCLTVFVVNYIKTRDRNHLVLREIYENAYLVTVFWLPAFFITVMYIYIFVQLRSFARREMSSASGLENKNTNGDSEKTSFFSKNEANGMLTTANHLTPPTCHNDEVSLGLTTDGAQKGRTSVGPHLGRPHRGRQPKWRNELRSGRKIFSQTGLLVVVYLICWLPYFLAALSPVKITVLTTLIALNSAVNPMLYAFD